MYAIQKYVLETMKEKGMKKSDLARRLGYTNISKGCRRLDAFLRDLECTDMILKDLRHALNVSKDDFQQKMRETHEELEEERRKQEEIELKNFRPFLFCQTERRIPSPIFVAAMLGADRMKIIELPEDFNMISDDKKKNIIKDRIAKTLQKYKGEILSFGKITCFTLKRFYDDEEHEREVYNLKGDLIPDPPADCREIYIGRARLTVKGRDITRLVQGAFSKDGKGE